MFELQIKDTKESKIPGGPLNLLKKTVDCLLDIVEEAEFKIDEGGIGIQRMDSMHVALADVFLSKNLFDSYRCDRNLVLGVNLKSFYGILKDIHLERDSTLELHCQDDAPYLTMTYESNTYNLSFKIKLFSYDIETYNFSEFKYVADMTMGTEKFMMLPKVVGSFSEFLVINAEKDAVTFMQKGEKAESTMVLRSSADGSVLISVAEPIRREIAMKYVKYMSKAGALTQKVRICMGTQSPLFFDFYLYDLGYMRFYIAPKAID